MQYRPNEAATLATSNSAAVAMRNDAASLYKPEHTQCHSLITNHSIGFHRSPTSMGAARHGQGGVAPPPPWKCENGYLLLLRIVRYCCVVQVQSYKVLLLFFPSSCGQLNTVLLDTVCSMVQFYIHRVRKKRCHFIFCHNFAKS